MNKTHSLIWRIFLFAFGLAVLITSCYLLNGGKYLTGADKFIWTSIFVMYIVFFCPFFFQSINTGNFHFKMPPLVLIFGGISGYIAASIIVIALLSAMIITLNIAIIAQLVLVFFFAIGVYFACFAESHIQSVASSESVKQASLSEIKARSASLSIMLGGLPSDYEGQAKNLLRVLDDIKYLSTVGSTEASDIEAKILLSIAEIKELADAAAKGGKFAASFEDEGNKLNLLVSERKLLRN